VEPDQRENLLVIADWLLGGKQAVLSRSQLQRVRDAVARALRDRGLDQ
jgi:hypothetical protein